jgi:hypothetical protein
MLSGVQIFCWAFLSKLLLLHKATTTCVVSCVVVVSNLVVSARTKWLLS